MAFTMDSNTDTGKVRVLVHDIDSTDYVFEDDYIEAVLEQNGDDLWLAAADLCKSLALKYAKEATMVNLDRMSIQLDKRRRPAFYIELAKNYSERSGSEVTEYIDSFAYDVNNLGIDETEYMKD